VVTGTGHATRLFLSDSPNAPASEKFPNLALLRKIFLVTAEDHLDWQSDGGAYIGVDTSESETDTQWWMLTG
jgi:hypothetical protein